MVPPLHISMSIITGGMVLPPSTPSLPPSNPGQSVFMMSESSGSGSPSNALITRFSVAQLVVEQSADAAYTGTSYHDGSGDLRNYRFLRQDGTLADRGDVEAAFTITKLGPVPSFDLMQYYHRFDVITSNYREGLIDAVVRLEDAAGTAQSIIKVTYPYRQRNMVETDLSMLRAMPFWIVERIGDITWPLASQTESIGFCQPYVEDGKVRYALAIDGREKGYRGRARQTLFHEIGHVIERGDKRIRDLVLLAMALDGDLAESEYARSHWREQFAESFELYIRAGAERFRRAYPYRAYLIEALLANDGVLPVEHSCP